MKKDEVNYHRAIYNTHPNVVEIIEEKDCFDKDGNAVIIDESKVDIEFTKIKTEYNSNQYKRDRRVEYPVTGDQLDMLWHAIDDGTLDKTSDFYTALKAIKDKYPKE